MEKEKRSRNKKRDKEKERDRDPNGKMEKKGKIIDGENKRDGEKDGEK